MLHSVVVVSARIGIATLAEVNFLFQETVRLADTRMYLKKQKGKK